MPKFYVTMTWHDWPEGGSYGTVVEAKSYAHAETLCRQEMAASYGQDIEEEVDPEDYSDEWHLVDCFLVDDFLKEHGHAQV